MSYVKEGITIVERSPNDCTVDIQDNLFDWSAKEINIYASSGILAGNVISNSNSTPIMITKYQNSGILEIRNNIVLLLATTSPNLRIPNLLFFVVTKQLYTNRCANSCKFA